MAVDFLYILILHTVVLLFAVDSLNVWAVIFMDCWF